MSGMSRVGLFTFVDTLSGGGLKRLMRDWGLSEGRLTMPQETFYDILWDPRFTTIERDDYSLRIKRDNTEYFPSGKCTIEFSGGPFMLVLRTCRHSAAPWSFSLYITGADLIGLFDPLMEICNRISKAVEEVQRTRIPIRPSDSLSSVFADALRVPEAMLQVPGRRVEQSITHSEPFVVGIDVAAAERQPFDIYEFFKQNTNPEQIAPTAALKALDDLPYMCTKAAICAACNMLMDRCILDLVDGSVKLTNDSIVLEGPYPFCLFDYKGSYPELGNEEPLISGRDIAYAVHVQEESGSLKGVSVL